MGAPFESGEHDLDAAAQPQAERKPVLLTFDAIYREHFAYVWRNARALGANHANVDDVVQDVFIVVHRRLVEFEGRSSVRTWLVSILLRVVQEHRRKWVRHQVQEAAEDFADEDTDASPLRNAEDKQAARLLTDVLGQMEEPQRVVFVLAELDRLTIPEIAELLQIKPNTAYSRLRLARHDFERLTARLRAKDTWRST